MSYLQESRTDRNSNIFIRDLKKKIFVIDSSVVFKWFFLEDESDTEIAKKLCDKLMLREFYAISPELLLYEILNVFKYRTNFKANEIREILQKISDIQIFNRIDCETYVEAYIISQKIEASLYDCIYIAMSEKYKAPFVTSDEKLCKKAKSNNYNVLLLSEFIKTY